MRVLAVDRARAGAAGRDALRRWPAGALMAGNPDEMDIRSRFRSAGGPEDGPDIATVVAISDARGPQAKLWFVMGAGGAGKTVLVGWLFWRAMGGGRASVVRMPALEDDVMREVERRRLDFGSARGQPREVAADRRPWARNGQALAGIGTRLP